MSEDRRPVGEDDVEAYIDGRLSPERAAVVSAYVASEPAARARIEADRALRDELRARLAHVAALPLPSRLRIATIQARRRAASSREDVQVPGARSVSGAATRSD